MTLPADVLALPRQYDVDDVKTALKGILESRAFELALQKVEYEKADGLEMPRPARIYTSGRKHLEATPCCEIISFPTTQRSDELTHQVIICWSITDTDEERLDKLVTRYLTATAYCLMGFRGGSLLPDVPAGITLGRRDYMPPDREQTPFVQTGIIEVTAEVVGLN
jgi:hypothetical protein